MIIIEAPIKLASPNVGINVFSPKAQQQHYYFKRKSKKNCQIIGFLLNSQREKMMTLPVQVRMTRYSKKPYDHDNFIFACKYIKDTIADFIIPGKAPGHADSSPLINWYYYQEKRDRESFKVEIFPYFQSFP